MITFHSIFVMLSRLSGDDMVCITLTQGKVATLDLCDWHKVKDFQWWASKKSDGYVAVAERNIDDTGKTKTVLLHRLIMGEPYGLDVDHKNHDKLNNVKSNLRVCTHQQNLQNRKSVKNSTSKFIGVSLESATKKWRGRISINGKNICLGCFTDEVEAAKARDKKALEIYGEFANLNFPP